MKSKPYDFTTYRPGLTLEESRLLDHIIRTGREVESVSKWCFYNVGWWMRENALKQKKSA